MQSAAEKIAGLVRERKGNLFVFSGNVYDVIRVGKNTYSDIIDFLATIGEKRFPQCLCYDIFSGVEIIRGEQEKILRLTGLDDNNAGPYKKTQKQNTNAELIRMLKQAKSGSKSPFPVNPIEAFTSFDTLLKNESSEPTLLIINYADTVFPASMQGLLNQSQRALSVALVKWARNKAIRKNRHAVAVISRNASDIDPMILERAFECVQYRIPKPPEEERKEFFVQAGINKDFLGPLAKATAGLSLKDLMDIADDSRFVSKPEEILERIFSAKQKILKEEYSELLEVMETKNGFEAIGGLEKPIVKLRNLANAMRLGKTSLVPQGVIFIGPPGTGKTILAEAFAKEAGLNFIKPKDIKNMFVGESERRMSAFLGAVKDLAPVCVFIDEFDQNQAQRGSFDGDSGVSRNLFKKMLEVMSDTSLRGKVLWIFATNRPDLIDPAMKRPGRCDLRVPFLSPTDKQLALIAASAFRQYPDMRSKITNWLPYAKKLSGKSGADMVEVVRRAWERTNELGKNLIDEKDMIWACKDYRPQIINAEDVRKMSQLAILECSSESLLPDNWKSFFKDRRHIKKKIKYNPVVN